MGNITSLGAAIFSDLSVGTGTIISGIPQGGVVSTLDEANFKARFASEARVRGTVANGFQGANSFTRVGSVREFPSIGTPANIVNVPVYGQRQSSTVQGQADAPSLELTVNFVPYTYQKGNALIYVLGNMVGDGIARPWRFTLLQSAPSESSSAVLGNTSSVAPATAGVTTSSTCTISGEVFTIGTYTSGVFREGTVLTSAAGTSIVAGTVIVEQLTGTLGGSNGATYRVSPVQSSTGFQAAGTTGTLTVAGTGSSGYLRAGMTGTGSHSSFTVYSQMTGTLGSVSSGTYSVSPSGTVGSGAATYVGSDGREYASLDTGGGSGLYTVPNTQYFWNGKLEALLVKPDLKDAITAMLTLSIQSEFYGGFTNS